MSDFANEHAVEHYGQAINQYVAWHCANQQSEEVKTVSTTAEIGRSIKEAKIRFHIRRYCADVVEPKRQCGRARQRVDKCVAGLGVARGPAHQRRCMPIQIPD